MAQQLRHYIKPSQRPTTTAHLAQTMSLLELNNQELLEKIEGELANNPALDLIEERRCPTCKTKLDSSLPCPKCTFAPEKTNEEPIVFVSSTRETSSTYSQGLEDRPEDEFSTQNEDLPTFVLNQIASELELEQRPIAAHILTSLDEDGFLLVTPIEIARYNHVLPSEVEEVLHMIQRSEPLGVGTRTPQEALLVQLESLEEIGKIPPKAKEMIKDGFELLMKRNFKTLGKMLKIPPARVEEIAEFISENLNPFPARAYWGSIRHKGDPGPQRYHHPDIIISCTNDDEPQLIIEVVWPLRGLLKINSIFKKAISAAPQDKEDKWKKDLEKASLLVKCLNQRNHTMVKLMQQLAKIQRDYILHGDSCIKPITRVKLSEYLGVHESTISRAVSGKSVQLPSGRIIPLSKFFDRSLHIRTALKTIVEKELTPLSDTKLALLLEKQGYNIARRTVAKYRSMEGIFPAHQRG